jgi:hypothetical protein
MWYGFGNQASASTGGEQTNPTTSVLLAELSSLASDNYELRVTVGASTVATFWVEHKTSTTVPGTLREGGSALGRRILYTTTQQSGQYVFRFKSESGDSVCVRVGTALSAAVAAATLQLEKMDG